MSGLLIMDPKDRFTAKQALMHPFFDGLRSQQEEEQIQKERERVLKRTESSANQRTGTMSRNGDQSRSRSGLRNNKIIKGGNQKRFGQHNNDHIQDMSNKSRSLGRKTTDKANLIGLPYGQVTSNIRDSSVSNNSNPAGNSSLAAYTSVGNKKVQQQYSTNNSQYNMAINGVVNNFM